MNTKTITGTAVAWVTEYCSLTPQEIAAGGYEPTRLHFSDADSKMENHGWTRVGTATITVELNDADDLLQSKVDSLTEQRATILAEAQQKALQIDGQIQNLLAITYDAGETA